MDFMVTIIQYLTYPVPNYNPDLEAPIFFFFFKPSVSASWPPGQQVNIHTYIHRLSDKIISK